MTVDATDEGYVTLSTSDYRLKRDVETMEGEDIIPTVMRLRPIWYKWSDSKKGDERHAGLIAHEVQMVLPGAVGGEKDATFPDGGIIPQGLNPNDLIAVLTRAVQQLASRVEELEKSAAG